MPKGFKGFQKGHTGFIPKSLYKEIGKKISIALTGKKLSKEHRKKLRLAKLGKKRGPLSEEHKKRIGLANSRRHPERSGKNSPTWKENASYLHKGYILKKAKDHPFKNNKGYVKEHRLIIEKMIGRYLKKDEVIHHLGEKTDNRPELLMAFCNNSAHMRFHKGRKVNPKEIIFDGRQI